MEAMDHKPDKAKEPYSPTNTPNPPQDMDPSRSPEKNNINNSSKKKKKEQDSKSSESNAEKKSTANKLGKSATETDNETNSY